MAKKHHFILTKHDRERIEQWIADAQAYAEVARRIGCNPSTISREVIRGNNAQGVYRAVYAHKKACARLRGRKLGKRKILINKELQEYVNSALTQKWSPLQIAETLKGTYTEDTMQVSPEAIYQYIYITPTRLT